MAQPHHVVIHEFGPTSMPMFDDEGDELAGFYFQIVDTDNEPISDLIGPYGYNALAENAGVRAFRSKDY